MKAKLTSERPPFATVEFDFNPETLSYSRQTKQTQAAGASKASVGATPSILLKSPPKSMTGTGYMIGDDVQDRADQLHDWMDPGGGLLGALIGAAVGVLTGGRINLAAKQPPLYFQWGKQMMRCIITSVNVTFERFSSSGAPDRAMIKFILQEEHNIFGMLPTNPTSGGLPGRQRHVVSASENVQTITTAAYGNPGMWRGVAEANGIDDPFRVRPGDTVYLPNASEILGKRGN
jgi:nucleoid-associated protein YgaU